MTAGVALLELNMRNSEGGGWKWKGKLSCGMDAVKVAVSIVKVHIYI